MLEQIIVNYMQNRILIVLVIALVFVGITGVSGQERMQGRGGANFDMSNFSGSISGQVIDSLSKEVVEFANIALYRQRDSSLVTGTMTDAQGNFKLEKLTPGRFYLEVKLDRKSVV